MKLILSAMVVMFLSGCGAAGPEYQAATLLKSRMKAPDSFVVKKSEIMWQGKGKNNRDAYVIKIVYTAQNTFGANLQECQMVGLSMDSKQVFWNKVNGFQECSEEDNPLFNDAFLTKVMASQLTE